MNCSTCGEPIEAVWRFCASCGTRLDAGATLVGVPAASAPEASLAAAPPASDASASSSASSDATVVGAPAFATAVLDAAGEDEAATFVGRAIVEDIEPEVRSAVEADADATMVGRAIIDVDQDATAVGHPAVGADPDATTFGRPALDADPEATGLGRPALDVDPDVTVFGRPPAAADPDATIIRKPRPATVRPAGTPRPNRPPSTAGARTRGTKSGEGGGSPEGPLEVGQSFGSRYHIIRVLGIGGMGAVYQAWDAELEVALALKVIRPDATADPEAVAEIERRFKRELLLARQVTHPNVVRIHDLGEIDGIKYITMPYVEGKDLSDILAEAGTLPVSRVLSIAKQVVSGLCAAHAAGVVHRDLKPANIMIDAEEHALIMDFGIARAATGPSDAGKGGPSNLAAASGDSGATRVGTIVGTLEYMAPEQARGVPVDQRADIYAFGLILSRMLVGKQFAEGATNAFEDLKARMEREPKKLREINPEIPEHVEAIVSKCVQPDPDARFATTEDLLHALERLDENGIPLPDPPPIWKSWRFWSVAASLMTVLVGGTWWFAQLVAVPGVEPKKEPVSVLVTALNNTTGDPAFNGVVEQSLEVGVEGASFVTAYPRRDAVRVASQLNAGKVLDEKVARLVAQREGVKVVLAGGIAREGSGYKVSLRGVNPADGKEIFRTEAAASKKDDVLAAVGRIAGDVRKSLGDTKTQTSGAKEVLSAASLDAVAEYIKGQELTRQVRDEEAIAAFRRATELDPNFGRAYSAWGTVAFRLGKQEEAEAQYKKAMSLLDRMTERERYRTLGVYYLVGSKNYDKAIEALSTLVKLYPSDAPGYNNLAVTYANKLDFPKASEMGRKALEILPRNKKYRSNYALYAMYAGDFKSAANEANRLVSEDPQYFEAYLPLAISALARGDAEAARSFYEKMGAVSAPAASKANIGIADIAIVEGRIADAIDLLTKGIAADQENKYAAGAFVKQMAIAEAHELEHDYKAAVPVARAATAGLKTEPVLVPAGRIFAAARQQRDIDEIAKLLANQFEPQKRAYARIIDALDYIARERYVDAVDQLKEAVKFADLWLARFYLGVAYETAGRHGEAFSEFEICQKRLGEATSLFIDDVPTFRYAAPLPYWRARAQEGLGQTTQAKANYEAFLALKKGPAKDPLVADARQRFEKLTATH